VELRRYLALAWKWSWLLVLGVLVGGGVAFLVSRRQTPIYSAQATVLVDQRPSGVSLTSADIFNSQLLAKVYSQLVTSSEVLAQVAQDLSVSFMDTRTAVSAEAPVDSRLINIMVTSTDPEVAAAVANETARVFATKVRQQQTGDAATFEDELKSLLADVQASIAERQQTIARLNGRPPDLSEEQRSQQALQAQLELESLRDYARSLQLRLFDARSQADRGLAIISLLNPAGVPAQPVSPQVTRDTILGAVLGLMLMVGIAALREYLDDTIKTPDDVGAATPDIPALGAITRFSASSERSRRPSRLAVLQQPRSAIAEAYRVIRTNLEFAQSGKGTHKTFLITSASPREGKSTTAANLALVLAQTGQRIILVDADMRRPSVHEVFGTPNTTGLSTLFLMETPNLHGLLRATEVENLQLLPCGPLPPNPAELLASPRMARVIDLLAAEADIVIFDSPPLLGVTDASVVAPRVDGVVLVVDSRRTRAGALKHAVEVLQRGHATVLGVVLNKVKALEGGDYYYYYSSYRSYAASPSSTNGNGANGTAAKGKGARLLGLRRTNAPDHDDRPRLN
jgi:capsular exopolysaccharide synthesis family protein